MIPKKIKVNDCVIYSCPGSYEGAKNNWYLGKVTGVRSIGNEPVRIELISTDKRVSDVRYVSDSSSSRDVYHIYILPKEVIDTIIDTLSGRKIDADRMDFVRQSLKPTIQDDPFQVESVIEQLDTIVENYHLIGVHSIF